MRPVYHLHVLSCPGTSWPDICGARYTFCFERRVSAHKFFSTSVDVFVTGEFEEVVPEIIHKKDELSADGERTAVKRHVLMNLNLTSP
jgi:radical SAM superfamily enzyme YgiQ (UPF0313 family)